MVEPGLGALEPNGGLLRQTLDGLASHAFVVLDVSTASCGFGAGEPSSSSGPGPRDQPPPLEDVDSSLGMIAGIGHRLDAIAWELKRAALDDWG